MYLRVTPVVHLRFNSFAVICVFSTTHGSVRELSISHTNNCANTHTRCVRARALEAADVKNPPRASDQVATSHGPPFGFPSQKNPSAQPSQQSDHRREIIQILCIDCAVPLIARAHLVYIERIIFITWRGQIVC